MHYFEADTTDSIILIDLTFFLCAAEDGIQAAKDIKLLLLGKYMMIIVIIFGVAIKCHCPTFD